MQIRIHLWLLKHKSYGVEPSAMNGSGELFYQRDNRHQLLALKIPTVVDSMKQLESSIEAHKTVKNGIVSQAAKHNILRFVIKQRKQTRDVQLGTFTLLARLGFGVKLLTWNLRGNFSELRSDFQQVHMSFAFASPNGSSWTTAWEVSAERASIMIQIKFWGARRWFNTSRYWCRVWGFDNLINLGGSKWASNEHLHQTPIVLARLRVMSWKTTAKNVWKYFRWWPATEKFRKTCLPRRRAKTIAGSCCWWLRASSHVKHKFIAKSFCLESRIQFFKRFCDILRDWFTHKSEVFLPKHNKTEETDLIIFLVSLWQRRASLFGVSKAHTNASKTASKSRNVNLLSPQKRVA